jgi:hypothetical protein
MTKAIEALVRARSVLRTCYSDTPEIVEKDKEIRQKVIERRMLEITEVINRSKESKMFYEDEWSSDR